jgi:hypothetical protein
MGRACDVRLVWPVVVIALAAGALLVTTSREAGQTAPPPPASAVLTTMAYGSARGEIGVQPGGHGEDAEPPMSLSGMSAPAEDTVFVADAVQLRIKKIGPGGVVTALTDNDVLRTLRAAGEVTREIDLAHLEKLAAMPDGRFVAFLADGNGRVEVFKANGRPLADGWPTLLEQMRANVSYKGREPVLIGVFTDQAGHLYISAAPADNDYNVSIAEFDGDLRFVRVVPGYSVGWTGKTFGLAPHRDHEPNDRVQIWSADGHLEAIVTLRPPQDMQQAEYGYATHEWRAIGGFFMDGRGDIYMVFRTPRAATDRITLMADFEIADDIVIYRFSGSGQFLSRRVMDGLPFTMFPPVAVDPNGDIYHFRYGAAGAELVRER